MQYTVTEITSVISNTLNDIGFFSLVGEVSGFKMSTSGHVYFNLKDESASISAVIWKFRLSKIGFLPKDGQKVIVSGTLKIYKVNGTYSVDCESIVDAGEGNISLMLEKRKKKYQELGYFDPSIKKEIPKHPKKIGIITSPTGAVIHDFLRVTERRNNTIDILILPAPVQGMGTAEIISARIEQANKYKLVDVLVIARGGGSVEDLLPFSEECLIEAIYRSEIPIISAIGHESDWTLADYVSDLRAGTPSIAAELVCEKSEDYISKIKVLSDNMTSDIKFKFVQMENAISQIGFKSLGHLISNSIFSYKIEIDSYLGIINDEIKNTISSCREEVSNILEDLKQYMDLYIEKSRSVLEVLIASLESLNPRIVLDKGYSVVSNEFGKIITKPTQVREDEILNVLLAYGKITVKVQANKK